MKSEVRKAHKNYTANVFFLTSLQLSETLQLSLNSLVSRSLPVFPRFRRIVKHFVFRVSSSAAAVVDRAVFDNDIKFVGLGEGRENESG